MAVACLALLVAMGGTSYAALTLPRNSVGANQLQSNAVTSSKIKNGTISAADLSSKTSAGLKGNTGPQGPQGPAGVAGAAGTALAYGDFTAAGAIQGASKSLGGVTVRQIQVGVYCMSGFKVSLNNIIVSVDATGPDLGATAQGTVDGLDQCPSGYQAEVQTYNGTAQRASEPFYVLFN